jgi:hypothetical protein
MFQITGTHVPLALLFSEHTAEKTLLIIFTFETNCANDLLSER